MQRNKIWERISRNNGFRLPFLASSLKPTLLSQASPWPSRLICGWSLLGATPSHLLRAKAAKPLGSFCGPQFKCLLVPFLCRLDVGLDADDSPRGQLVGIVGTPEREGALRQADSRRAL